MAGQYPQHFARPNIDVLRFLWRGCHTHIVSHSTNDVPILSQEDVETIVGYVERLMPTYLQQFREDLREPRACLAIRHSLAHRIIPSLNRLGQQNQSRLNKLRVYLPLGAPIKPTEILNWDVNIDRINVPSFMPLVPVQRPLRVPDLSFATTRVFPEGTQEDVIMEVTHQMNELYKSRAQVIAQEIKLYTSFHFDRFQTPLSEASQKLLTDASAVHRELQLIYDFDFLKGVGEDASKHSLAMQVYRIPPEILIKFPEIILFLEIKGHPLDCMHT